MFFPNSYFFLFCIPFVARYGNAFAMEFDLEKRVSAMDKHRFSEFYQVAKFLEPTTKEIKTERCRNQMNAFLESLANSSLWAVQMLDASGKFPQGLLSSDAYDLGDYDGCLEINLKRNGEDDILGKYCLAEISPPSECRIEIQDLFRNSEVSIFENLIIPVLSHGFINNTFRSGLCVPHECTSHDVEIMLGSLYTKVAKINCGMEIRIPENACSSSEVIKKSAIGTFMSRAFISLFLGVGIATILDLWRVSCNRKFPAVARRFLLPFSAYRNYKWLVSARQTDRVSVADSLKVFSIIFLTVNRRLKLLLLGPILNRRIVDKTFSQSFKENLFDGADELIFGTLFVVSGFLHFNKAYESLRKNPSVKNWPVYFHHLLKMLPLYIAAIFFFAFAYEDFGDGPLWKERIKSSVDKCKECFTDNSMNFANLIKLNESCIFESSYFTVFAGYFLILPFLVKITMKSSTTDLILLGLLTSSAFLMPLRTIYDSELSNSTKGDFRDIKRGRGLISGATTTNQAFFYFTGTGSSMMYTRIKEGKWLASEINGYHFRLVAAFFAGIFLISLSFNYSQAHRLVRNLMVQEYQKLIWSLIVSLTITQLSTRDLPYLTPMLKNKCLSFLGSFTYPYLMVLGYVQLYSTGTTRTLEYFSYPRLVWMSAADLVATYILAFVLYFTIHKPVSIILEENILKRPSKGDASNNFFFGFQKKVDGKKNGVKVRFKKN